MRSRWCVLALTLVLVLTVGLGALAKTELTVVWHSGNLADLLIEIAREYTKETGVVIRGDFVPYGPPWHDKIATEFAAHGSGFDLCIFDSQSMSEFASQGHVVLLNPLLEKSRKVKASDFDPFALRQYAEYPEGSGNIYALPVNQDCMGLVYRKDLFEDPDEKAAFKKKYGYDLAIPKTYAQLRDIAEFFTRPKENLYGLALYGGRDYDACTSPFNGILWSFGGELWNPKTGQVKGYINSPAAVKALEFYKSLFKYAPPGATSWFFDETNTAIHEGLVAMGINWYYFFGAHVDPKVSRMAGKLGFATLPGETGPDGKFRRHASVGGQGLSISKYSKNKDEAWKFLEWFMQREQQWDWVVGGAKTGRIDVLKDPKFVTATPFNDTFAVSMSTVQDYWHLPEYPQLLDIEQKYVNAAINGVMSPKEALDRCAEEHEEIMRKAGYLKK